MNWRMEVDEVLRNGMRYAFKTVDGKFPILDDKAYEGEPESGLRGTSSFIPGDSGFLDCVLALVSDLRKKSFKAGFLAGARAAYADLGKEEHSFDEDLSRQGAERAFIESEEKREEC